MVDEEKSDTLNEGVEQTEETSEKPEVKEEPVKESPPEDDEPQVRQRGVKSPKDYIIERKNAKIAKLEAKKHEIDEVIDTDEDLVAPEDEKLISKVVEKHLKPIIEKSHLQEDDQEIKDFLNKNPEFSAYEDKVRKWSQHPSRQNVPIKSIFYEVAGDSLMKIGADRAKEAERKAKDSQVGGGSLRGGEMNKFDFSNMPKEEFDKIKEEIRQKRRD